MKSKSKYFLPQFGWLAFLILSLYQIFNASKIGTYWDYQIDDGMALLNLDWLKYGVDVKDETFQLLTPYGYALTYIFWLPAQLYFHFVSETSFTAAAIESQNWLSYRNVSVYLIYLIGVLAITTWSKLILKIPSYIVAIFLLFSFPTISGYGMMNPKDIPIFSGVACALALSFSSKQGKSMRAHLINTVWINLSILFVLGVRPGAMFLLCFIFVIQCWQANDKKHYLRAIAYGAPSIIYCYLVSATAREFGFLWFFKTIESSSNYTAWQGTMLLWGQPFTTPISRFYQSGVLISQIPIFVLLFLIGSIIIFVRKNRPLNSFTVNASKNFFTTLKNPICLPPLTLVFLLLYVILSAPMLYDDARQTLFIWALIIPTTIILMKFVIMNMKSKFFLFFLCISIFLPVIDSIKLAPYAYTYRNEVARFSFPQGFETDFWGLSGKESAEWIIENNSLELSVASNPMVVYQSFTPKPWLNLSEDLPERYIYQQIRRPFGVPEILTECDLIHTVSRKPLIGEEMVMGTVRLCERSKQK
jgi:hypothetical protein